MKKLSTIFLIWVILCTGVCTGFAQTTQFEDRVSLAADYLVEKSDNLTIGAVGGDWTILGLARYDAERYADCISKYTENAIRDIRACDGVLDERKNTEYARVALTLTAAGIDADNAGGYNLFMPLTDDEKTMKQGINGAIWALIALSARADLSTAEMKAAKEKYLDQIVSAQTDQGGWALAGGTVSETDVTAMALCALSSYRARPYVQTAAEAAFAYLSAMQENDGSMGDYAESTAQTMCALAAWNIPMEDARFVKNGRTLFDGMEKFSCGDGSYAHTKGGEVNRMASEQCFYAMVAQQRMSQGKCFLYDMSDQPIKDVWPISGVPTRSDAVHPHVIGAHKTFLDIQDHEAKTAIEALASADILHGMDDTTFAPNAWMTRAEFAAVIVKGLGLHIDGENRFADVTADQWYEPYVRTAAQYGVVQGVSEDRFMPDGQITREEAAVMVCRAARLCGIEKRYESAEQTDRLSLFDDYRSVSDWATEALTFCYDYQILTDTAMTIAPQECVCRAEIAQMLYRMLTVAELLI